MTEKHYQVATFYVSLIMVFVVLALLIATVCFRFEVANLAKRISVLEEVQTILPPMSKIIK